MARFARKQMADMRAMEEEAERTNPLDGRGATPSMGLSQFRGGGGDSDSESDDDAMAQGKALSEHLHKLHGKGYARNFHQGMSMSGGLGTGRYEGEGRLIREKMIAANAIHPNSNTINPADPAINGGGLMDIFGSILPLVGKLFGSGDMSKNAHDKLMGLMRPPAVGTYRPTVTPLPGPSPRPLLRPPMEGSGLMDIFGTIGNSIMSLFGKGQMTQEAHDKMMKLCSRKPRGKAKLNGGFWGALAGLALPLLSSLLGKGKITQKAHDELSGMLSKCGMAGSGRMVGAGDLEIEVKHTEPKGKAKAIVGAGDGRRKRAEVVKKVMAEKGMKMIEASKYVKAHNLY